MIDRLKQFLRDVYAEMGKVTWPSRAEIRGSTVVVIVTVALLTVFIGLVDRGLSYLLGIVLPR